ncbi:MAG: ABC transporter permease [Pyrinomonadaceae bacterium]
MLASLHAEFIKTRRLWLWFIAAGAGIVLSILIWLNLSSTLERVASEQRAEEAWQNGVIGDTTIITVLILPTLAIIITAIIFFVEHRSNMWKQLRVTPQ